MTKQAEKMRSIESELDALEQKMYDFNKLYEEKYGKQIMVFDEDQKSCKKKKTH